MNNNDILIRLRYALDIKDSDMVKIFTLGGIKITKDNVQKMLIKTVDSYDIEVINDGELEENKDIIKCDNFTLDAFLNGFMSFLKALYIPNTG